MYQLMTPDDIWQKVESEKTEAETEIVHVTQNDGVVTEEVYFSGVCRDKCKSRIYGAVCSPQKDGAKSALLFVGASTDDMDFSVLQSSAKNGYVAMQIDYRGQGAAGQRTIYPQCLAYCQRADDFYTCASPVDTAWFQYVVNTVAAVDYLSSRADVEKVSVVAIKKGVEIAMPILAFDKRILSGAVLLGSVVEDFDNNGGKAVANMSRASLNESLTQSVHEQVWETGVAPQSYAPLVKVPLLYVSSLYGEKTLAEKYNTFSRLKKGCFCVLPDTFDFLPDKYLFAVGKWLSQPWFENVEVAQVKSADGTLTFSVKNAQTKNVELWFSRNKRREKNWIKANLTETDGVYTARCALYSNDCVPEAFALDRGELPLASPLVCGVASGLKTEAPVNLLYGSNSENIFVPIADGWHGVQPILEKRKGPFKIEGMFGTSFATFAYADDKVGLDEVTMVAFDVYCETPQTLKVSVRSHASGDDEYVCYVRLAGGGLWQRVTVSETDLKTADGIAYDGNSADVLLFESKDGILLTNMLVL